MATLKRTSWRISGANGAAVILGVVPTTLHSKMKKLRDRSSEPLSIGRDRHIRPV